jgi:hypothetical protein
MRKDKWQQAISLIITDAIRCLLLAIKYLQNNILQ